MNSSNPFRKRLFLPLAVLLLLGWFVLRQVSLVPAELAGHAGDRSALDRAVPYYGPRKSIAILPFIDTSPGQDQAWLAQGLPRELTRHLAAHSDLQVTAPTSAFFFSTALGTPEVIAQRLQVSFLLAGTAELRDSRLLISTKLHDARRKRVVWQDKFEVGLEQAPSLITEILDGIQDGVGVSGVVLSEAMPRHLQAWVYYLQGRYLIGPPAGGDFVAAGQTFRAALELQPDYSCAWQGLAETFLASQPPDLENAEAALFRAFETEPQAPDALGLLSYMQRNYAWNWPAAAESALLALKGRPGDARLMVLASRALFSLGQFQDAENYLQQSIKRDPVNLASRLSLGLAQEFKGDFEAALTSYRILIGLKPDFPAAHAFRARIKVLQNKPDSAMDESEKEPDPFWKEYSNALALIARGDTDEAGLVLEALAEAHGVTASFQLAELHAYAGETEQAFEWLARALERKDGGLAGINGNRLLQNLHDDTRWADLLSGLGITLDAVESSD